MELNERRAVLYVEYLSDIEEFRTKPSTETLREKWEAAMEYINDDEFDWIDIYVPEEKEPVGFMIIGHNDQCHPNADIFFSDIFIDYRYRNRGIMTSKVKEVIKTNKSCCYFVQKNNNYAQRWLNKLFINEGFVSYKLDRSCILISDDDKGFYGWINEKAISKVNNNAYTETINVN